MSAFPIRRKSTMPYSTMTLAAKMLTLNRYWLYSISTHRRFKVTLISAVYFAAPFWAIWRMIR